MITAETVIPIKSTGNSQYAIVQPGSNKPNRTRSFRIERIENGLEKINYQIKGTEANTERTSSFRIERLDDPRSNKKPEVNGYHSVPVQNNASYHLIRQPSLRKAKKIRSELTGGIKVDTYSVGVIMSTTVMLVFVLSTSTSATVGCFRGGYKLQDEQLDTAAFLRCRTYANHFFAF